MLQHKKNRKTRVAKRLRKHSRLERLNGENIEEDKFSEVRIYAREIKPDITQSAREHMTK